MMVVPVSLAEANAYVEKLHRHNGRLPAAKFAVGLIDDDGNVIGVAVAGLPKARLAADGGTLEVSRVCTDGSRNACSALYGACLRAAKALGYSRVITYTLQSEVGASLRASGWTLSGEVKGESWQRRELAKGRAYQDRHDTGDKTRWEYVIRSHPARIIWPASNASAQTELFA